MQNKELLKELETIINQTRTIAGMSPGSIDETIYNKCYNAYKVLEANGNIDINDILGFSRPYADRYGYDAPLLEHISKMEKLIKMGGKI
jgi:hypothetical protein